MKTERKKKIPSAENTVERVIEKERICGKFEALIFLLSRSWINYARTKYIKRGFSQFS